MTDALDERPQSVFNHPLVEQAAPARVLLVQLFLTARRGGRLAFLQPVLFLGHVDEGALQALGQIGTLFSQVLKKEADINATEAMLEVSGPSFTCKSFSDKPGSAAKTMTRGRPWKGNRSSCSRFDSRVFSNESRMYSNDEGLE